ncbi:MAG TPA: hypothetical protein VHN37_09575 [Actinomycetota bacterium]|nr:hypothetical protein [Actinomycetota bacterium]
MDWILCLGHGALAALLLPFGFAPEAARRRAIEAAAVVGVALGAALVVAAEGGGVAWRTALFESGSTVPAAVAAAAAWVVTGALAHTRPKVADAALVGVASTGLILAAAGRWAVPALMFWLCSSAAIAAAGSAERRWTWSLLAVSDAAVCAATLLHVRAADAWELTGVEGPAAGALVAAAVVRGGAHLFAPWPSLGAGARAVAPLFAGGAAVLAARAGLSEPWLAAALFAGGVAVAVLAFVRDDLGGRSAAAWATSLALGACFVSPGHAGPAGAAAVLAVTGVALWPYAGARGGVSRALLVSAVPLTISFAATAGGASDAFARATAGDGSTPWTLVAVLFPLLLACGAVLGGRAGRTAARELVPEAVLATWLTAAAALTAGVVPGAVGDGGVLGDSGGTIALQVAALAAGTGAALYARRAPSPLEPPEAGRATLSAVPLPVLPRASAWVAFGLAAATVAGAAWLAVSGLRVGFL